MKKTFKKLLSILMVFCMVMGMMPVQAFAVVQTYVATVSAEPAEAGTVYIDTPGVTEIPCDGTGHRAIAETNKGYKLVGWYKNDVFQTNHYMNTIYPPADATQDYNYVAKFVKAIDNIEITMPDEAGETLSRTTVSVPDGKGYQIQSFDKLYVYENADSENYTFIGEDTQCVLVAGNVVRGNILMANPSSGYGYDSISNIKAKVNGKSATVGEMYSKPYITFEYTVSASEPAPTPTPTPTLYNVWVAGTQVTSGNATDILGDGAASYNPTTNTLTVSKNITATGTTQDAIYANTGADFAYFNVVVADGVTLSAADGNGIFAEDGSVNLKAGNITVNADVAIFAGDNVTIECGKFVAIAEYGIYAEDGSVNLKAGDITIEATKRAINGYKDVTIECADLTITSDNYNGIYAYSGSVNLKAGNVAIDANEHAIYGYKGVTVECNQFEAAGYDGIYAEDGSVNLKAGDIAIEADECTIYGYEDVTVDCDKFEAAADYGIYADSGSLNLKAGDVAIEATKRAIYGYKDVTVDCNQFEAAGDYGIYAYSGSANLKAGDVAIDANEHAIYGYEDVTVDCDKFEAAADYGIYAGDGSVNLKAGDVAIEATECAIYGYENVTVDCDKFEAAAEYGIYAENAEAAEDGSVNLKAGDVTIEAVYYAIYSNEDVTIDCDKFEATGNCGIYGYEDITINCADRTITGGNYGIAADKGSIIIENGDFDIQSTEAGEYETDYHALYFGEDFTYPTGTTVIAATEVDGDFKEYDIDKNTTYDHVKITVPAPVQPTVALDETAITLTVGGTATLVPTITPADLPNYALSWASDDESVATVDSYGTVRAVAPGTATITVTLMPGAMPTSEEDPVLPTASCEVTVVPAEVPQEPTTSVTVVKEWNVPEGTNIPGFIEVYLLANGQQVGDTPVRLTADDDWTYTFENLPIANEEGKAIEYTVAEVEIEGFESTVGEAIETDTGIEIAITNSLKEEGPEDPETVTVAGTKTWVGDTEADRPESIIVNLLANGNVIDEREVTSRSQWTFHFDELPKYDEDGIEIEYSVEEEEVEGYTATYDGYNITNTKDSDEEGGNGGATTPTTPSAPSTPSVPDTSDNTNTLMYLTSLICAAAALVAVVIYRRKRSAE